MNKRYNLIYLAILLGVSQLIRADSGISFKVKNETKKPLYVMVEKDREFRLSANPHKIGAGKTQVLGYKKAGPKKGQFVIKWSYDGKNWYTSDINSCCCLELCIKEDGEFGKKMRCIKKWGSFVKYPKEKDIWGFKAASYYHKIPGIVLRDKELMQGVISLLEKIVDGAERYAQQRAKGRKVDEVKPPYIDPGKIKLLRDYIEKYLQKRMKIEVKQRYVS